MATPEVAVIGGGIVGLATARELARRDHRVLVLEAEPAVGRHQTGNNSGVIHSGLYYRPGSLKARLCTEGREEMFRFCEEHGVPAERCGKLVLATREDEIPRLDELERRGRANGLDGLERLGPDEIAEREPACRGLAGLLVPATGICDYGAVARALAADIEVRGGEIRTGSRVLGASRKADGVALRTSTGELAPVSRVVNCSGLQADRVARSLGDTPDVRIVPFRGEYVEIVPERRDLVRHLVYPVPDPRFPFLGVHFTRTVDGRLEAGPNAVPALAREGYSWSEISFRDLAEVLSWPGFWRLAGRHAATGTAEIARSWSRRLFVRALRRLVPEVRDDDVRRGGAGVRAQAVDRRGRLLDDFSLVRSERVLHVLNAPSPAATASLAIARELADRLFT